jgi:glycosyltransferase involved in cell wall biosynthesis
MRIAFLENPEWRFTGPRAYRSWVEKALAGRHELGFFKSPPKDGFDVLHVLDVKHASLSSIQGVRIPVVADVHDHYWAEFVFFPSPDIFLRRLLQRVRRIHYTRIINRADAVIAHTRVVARYIEHDNLHLVNYGIDFSSLDSSGKIDREPVLLLVGRDCLRKGLPVIIKALSKIIQRFPGMRLVVIGDEYWHTKMWSRIISSGLPVEFLPGMPFQKLVEWYQRASVLLLPSYIETFPLAVLDAMAAGLPVVASDVGGIPDQITSGQNGLLIKPGDADDLAEKITMILEDEELRKNIVSRAMEGIGESFSLEGMAKGLEQVYRSVGAG